MSDDELFKFMHSMTIASEVPQDATFNVAGRQMQLTSGMVNQGTLVSKKELESFKSFMSSNQITTPTPDDYNMWVYSRIPM